jgi:hypothetical protein
VSENKRVLIEISKIIGAIIAVLGPAMTILMSLVWILGPFGPDRRVVHAAAQQQSERPRDASADLVFNRDTGGQPYPK